MPGFMEANGEIFEGKVVTCYECGDEHETFDPQIEEGGLELCDDCADEGREDFFNGEEGVQVTPKRIQRRRTKGFKLPEGAICVTRPGEYGNPFKVGHRYAEGDSFLRHYGEYLDDGVVTSENCLVVFAAYCANRLRVEPEWLEPLRGRDLACWCPATSDNCHAAILLRLANA